MFKKSCSDQTFSMIASYQEHVWAVSIGKVGQAKVSMTLGFISLFIPRARPRELCKYDGRYLPLKCYKTKADYERKTLRKVWSKSGCEDNTYSSPCVVTTLEQKVSLTLTTRAQSVGQMYCETRSWHWRTLHVIASLPALSVVEMKADWCLVALSRDRVKVQETQGINTGTVGCSVSGLIVVAIIIKISLPIQLQWTRNRPK